MLQKIVNGIAIASGVVSITVVGAVGIVYLNKDAIIENVKGKVMEAVTDKLGGLGDLGGSLGGGGLGLPSPSTAAPDAPAASPQSPIPFGF
tara:strand:+ start:284 stop:556 length:273 start_codon:yes stop_codon:yes gene_type:complete